MQAQGKDPLELGTWKQSGGEAFPGEGVVLNQSGNSNSSICQA